MKKLFAVSAIAAGVCFAAPANATVFLPGDIGFQVSGNPFTGTDPVSASIGNEGLNGSGTDQFVFTIGPMGGDLIGYGSGSVTTTFSGMITAVTNLDFGEVSLFNGFDTYIVPIVEIGHQETGGLSDIPIYSGVLNTLTVNYFARGEGSYGGTLNFTPVEAPVPEPATWAMLVLGLGAVGAAMRRRNRQTVSVRYGTC